MKKLLKQGDVVYHNGYKGVVKKLVRKDNRNMIMYLCEFPENYDYKGYFNRDELSTKQEQK